MSALQPLSYQLVTTSLRLIAAVLGLGLVKESPECVARQRRTLPKTQEVIIKLSGSDSARKGTLWKADLLHRPFAEGFFMHKDDRGFSVEVPHVKVEVPCQRHQSCFWELDSTYPEAPWRHLAHLLRVFLQHMVVESERWDVPVHSDRWWSGWPRDARQRKKTIASWAEFAMVHHILIFKVETAGSYLVIWR
jgi:hypothetical protein